MDPNRYRRAAGARPGSEGSGPAPVEARLVFAEYAADSIHLDCVAAAAGILPVGGRRLQAGEPFSLSLGVPGYGWRALALVTLERWARDARLLRIELVSHGVSAVARVSDRGTTVVFDLLAPTGI